MAALYQHPQPLWWSGCAAGHVGLLRTWVSCTSTVVLVATANTMRYGCREGHAGRRPLSSSRHGPAPAEPESPTAAAGRGANKTGQNLATTEGCSSTSTVALEMLSMRHSLSELVLFKKGRHGRSGATSFPDCLTGT
jgi:hypothetical protein